MLPMQPSSAKSAAARLSPRSAHAAAASRAIARTRWQPLALPTAASSKALAPAALRATAAALAVTAIAVSPRLALPVVQRTSLARHASAGRIHSAAIPSGMKSAQTPPRIALLSAIAVVANPLLAPASVTAALPTVRSVVRTKSAAISSVAPIRSAATRLGILSVQMPRSKAVQSASEQVSPA